ncbi:esterase family protein [Bacteroides thetaiotaomicron]|uniref:Esterase family protein n=1 Tax=Bacteroides thetaiotaomicron TaxID=818 RepID=A0A7J5JQD8_BACT4|nr:alpha/beta hydrolase family protein [Bacteroides thetaiotaomicron]KAB4415901.1 esterase family protein [Bacteroides thetaiotaomicron]KAB4431735.1 esterase family protein [Bacteroides thetaiotaomicron]KAB4438075.1 esterase family protein [Bacteroides thetaiotaomicron]KAB4440845.1 esterase family protein [Bacteroides thetaiotaomicron]KAB4453640.1 esterase family protein [Bacteroides thetaiotaomicron]
MRYFFIILWVILIGLPQKTEASSPSRMLTDTIHSKVLNAPRAYTVYLPQGFDENQNKKYPVLYLLHGMWGNNTDWMNSGHLKEVTDRLVASEEACEMIIVSPDAGGGDPNVFQNGYFDMPEWKYETFFFMEFLPSIEKRYRVAGDKQHRAIAGLSMGGGGATAYGLRHPDLFCAVYAMSALMDIPEEGAARFDDPNGKLAILTRSVIEHSCVKYVVKSNEDRRRDLRTVAWFVDCGDDDFLLNRNIEFYRAMKQAGVPCQFRVRDGGHDWEYWHSALYICLPFVTRNFKS